MRDNDASIVIFALPNFASLKNSRLGGFEVLENKKIIKKNSLYCRETVMAAELLGGADVGAVFGELLEVVLNEINKAAFKTRLRQIKLYNPTVQFYKTWKS